MKLPESNQIELRRAIENCGRELGRVFPFNLPRLIVEWLSALMGRRGKE